MSVKVAVRVRPFNKRQQQMKCRCCVKMEKNTTHLLYEEGQCKSFVYDYSFWSHDKFMVDPDGIYIPVDEKYACQDRVYREIGSDILDNAWNGYHCCLFAYGQTGSGKSYSMLGYGENKGIIPRVCDSIFQKIHKTKDEKVSYEVKVSMMEIYNQSIRDLLGKNKKSDLKICEHKKLGVYVEGLQKKPVHSYKEIQRQIDEGSNHRSIAATLMNQSSSRSHTIVTINFVQKIQVTMSQTSIKYSTINLVDLAGSQCVGKTGVDSKDRLRETAKINQSLSTLGRVIQILAENASRMDKIFVPYRDSKLTFILRNALGGNSRTAMICAISPADDNYEETLSTLRYAHRAKKIQNKAMVNESDVDKLIRMLRQENQMLKKMLREAKFTKTVINQQVISNVQEMNSTMVGFGFANEDDEFLLDDLEIGESKDISFTESTNSLNDKIDLKIPYITNVSEDPLLTGRLKYSLSTPISIGNKHADPKPTIQLAALGIQQNHARIFVQENKVFIEVFSEKAMEYTYVNGQYLTQPGEKVELYECDRLVFGTGSVFLVKIYGGEPRMSKNSKKLGEEEIDYQFAMLEIQEQRDVQKSSKTLIIEEEEIRRQILTQIQQQYQKQKEQNDLLLQKKLQEQEEQYKQRIIQLEKAKNEQNQILISKLSQQQQESKKLKSEHETLEFQILQFQKIQSELKATNQQKSILEQHSKVMEEKLSQMKILETQLTQIQKKTQTQKQLIEKREEQLKKQLEVKTIICNNENILNQYKLELSKKHKNANQVRDLLVKKERIQLQKQLIELVPMVEKFNLIAKEMQKEVECGLSINYKYISDVQVVECLKSGSYKNKLEILIHVLNKQQQRSYIWSVKVFKNRFQLALSLLQLFIRDPEDPLIHSKESDPYWDPPVQQPLALGYVSLQPLFYGLAFEGEVNLIKHGEKVGSAHVHIYPTNNRGDTDLSSQVQEGIKIYNPRDWIEKNLYFYVCISHLRLDLPVKYKNISLSYDLLQNSFRTTQHKEVYQNQNSVDLIKMHTMKEMSEATILHYTDRPLAMRIFGDKQGEESNLEQTLTIRNQRKSSKNKASFNSSDEYEVKPFNSYQSPVKSETFFNNDIMSKIQVDYNRKMKEKEKKVRSQRKTQLSTTLSQKKIRRDKDNCIIF